MEKNDRLSENELERYSRQLMLGEIGSDGQLKLKNSRVLIVGAGGLGSPAAMYLAGAGVGNIGIIDADTVSLSNLQRQIMHNEEREGINKSLSARRTLEALNGNITVEAYPCELTAENAADIIEGFDFVLDCTDNFETKFLINDMCVLLGKPFCHGGIQEFSGQVMTYACGDEPCYRCIFGDVPDSDSVPRPSTKGVIGAVAGVIGSIQALEAVKYLTGAGELLTGRMLIFDALRMTARTVRFHGKNENCSVCRTAAGLME